MSVLTCSQIGVTEDAIVTFERGDLEFAAQGAQPGTDPVWTSKLFGDAAEGVPMAVFKTEVAGFLVAVDREVARLGH